jgi:hypothetical protein
MNGNEIFALFGGMFALLVLPLLLGWFLTRRLGTWPGALLVAAVFAAAGAWFEPFFGSITGGAAFLLAMFSSQGKGMAGAYLRLEGRRRR